MRGLQFKLGQAVRDFCECIKNKECPVSAVDPHFSEVVNIEINICEEGPQLPFSDIPKAFRVDMTNLEFAVVLVLRGAHFISATIDKDGNCIKYDDMKNKPEIFEPDQLVNPQHIIYFKRV